MTGEPQDNPAASGGRASFMRHGGALALDFVNTVNWRGREEPVELLPDYGRLLDWGSECGLYPAATARQARATGEAAARRQLARARRLREALHRLFAARIEHAPAPSGDLALLNRVLARAAGRRRLAERDGRIGWTADPRAGATDLILAAVARSAADVLTGEMPGRIGRCANAACAWLFLDTGRGARRRWCSMAHCGNRAKAARHYRRHRRAGAAPAHHARG